MVVKSKLKMALAADKNTSFSKLHQKKVAKVARKDKAVKSSKKVEQEWEDVEGQGEDEEEEDAEEGDSEDEDEEEGNGPTEIDFAAIDESDSDSSVGGDENEEDDEDDDEDDEDIPMSDLEDLDDEEREDMIPHQRLTINNTVALTAALKRISLPVATLPFSEHQSITLEEPTEIADVSDDLSRELAFYSQSLEAVKAARVQLKAEGVSFTRPTDYFAEMVKADEHMEKIKRKLIDEAAGKKASADARKQRDLKKFGKQVQVAKLQERDKERKVTLDKIKTLKRKRQGADTENTKEADLFDVALEEETKPSGNRSDRKSGPNKRQKKDEKFGHGGKKRFKKSGDAESTGDLTGFSVKKMKGGGAKGGAKTRPGKARRAGGKK
ncbi:putative rRNA-processing protein EBP2 [Sclerotinia borealis F-4128]|uniref:Putative rRNA-processing protein EBP2 n=1 Tax=Sclerotinia borealis (strain F-4128) TaxID=1432307 RepID=W9C7B5_SCLBF|nr:putative rRNA-processing protein EBP2 [Sclerotinia borealis F-4128]